MSERCRDGQWQQAAAAAAAGERCRTTSCSCPALVARGDSLLCTPGCRRVSSLVWMVVHWARDRQTGQSGVRRVTITKSASDLGGGTFSVVTDGAGVSHGSQRGAYIRPGSSPTLHLLSFPPPRTPTNVGLPLQSPSTCKQWPFARCCCWRSPALLLQPRRARTSTLRAPTAPCWPRCAFHIDVERAAPLASAVLQLATLCTRMPWRPGQNAPGKPPRHRPCTAWRSCCRI